MTSSFELIQPCILPPLDPSFQPAVLLNHSFCAGVERIGVPLVIGLERCGGELSRFETKVLPNDHPHAALNLNYVERLVKFLLWQRGGFRIYIGGPQEIGAYIHKQYSRDGSRKFDFHFMGEEVYEEPFEVVICSPDKVPVEHETGKQLGRHLSGFRIGFDLGASDRKASAVVNGNVVYSEEVIWEPRVHSDPDYHYREIMAALKSAASKMPKVDAIGGSSAGIFIDNRPMVASLFRSVARERYGEIKELFLRISRELGTPLEVINDGDVTALAGSMSIGDIGILGIALGSSEAAGYINQQGQITGWLNELAFAPIDYAPTAPVDEWSGDTGCGASYLSQQCVFRLAPKAGIDIPAQITDAEKLQFVQEKLESGHPGAVKIWQSQGVYLGYALAHYADFYELKHILILGRCTTGSAGDILLSQARAVLQNQFPDLDCKIKIHLPDEKVRRIGQSVAAASLPVLLQKEE